MGVWRAEGQSWTTASVVPGRLVEGWFHVLGEETYGEE